MLPLEGDVVRGKLLDLSLGGCCIETGQPLTPGARTEIVLRVNDASFRAISHIVSTRGRLAGLQFTRLTDGGNRMLQELVSEVEKFHAAMSVLRAERRIQGSELFLDEEQVPDLRKQFPILRRVVTEQKAHHRPSDHEGSRIITPGKKIYVVSIDLLV